MQHDISLSKVKHFPPLMWILLFGSFITRGSFYMVWPFLAVILYEKFALSATQVGLVLTSAATVSVFVSFIGSSLSDRIGRNKLMYATGILYIISFALLANVNTVAGFVVVITLCSIATALWRPLTSALIGDIIDEAGTRELAMQSMYFVVNVGCAVGPMIGVWLGLTGEQSSFYITTIAFAVLLVLLNLGFRNQSKRQVAVNEPKDQIIENNSEAGKADDLEKSESSGMKQTFALLLQDRLLQCLILANVICMFVYAQMDSSLIQYLTREQVPNLLELISSLIFTNAMIIITSQFILLKAMAKYSLVARIQMALVLLCLSQVWFALNPLEFYWGWIGAVVVMSLAETILFPSMNVHIDRIAPQHLRGAYFGAASFYEFGFAFAPLGGGIILDLWGGTVLFFVSAALTLVVMLLYSVLDKMPRPSFAADM